MFVSGLSVNAAADLPTATTYALSPGLPTPGLLSLLRPLIAITVSAGILTRFPSTTLFSLALGADSPCVDERCAGNLGLRRGSLSLPLSLLMSAFALLISPASFTRHLHRLTERSPIVTGKQIGRAHV